MPNLGNAVPILRSFDEDKARAFYLDFLGAELLFEHRFGPDAPLYMAVALGTCELHLSEHHGDAAPGAAVRIQGTKLKAYMQELRDKAYKFAGPGDPEEKPWGLLEIAVMDPFYNRLIFFEDPR